MKKFTYGFCLWSSIVINILLIIDRGGRRLWWREKQVIGSTDTLTWTMKAAMEAEAVAAISCSNHGLAYLDGLIFEGQPVCECYGCYGGPDCSQFLPNCVADADSGDPIFLEPFWIQHATESAIVISGWHRMSYRFSNDETLISLELEKYIHKIHYLAGNAITEGRYLVFGVGSSQLLSAAVYALSNGNSSFPSKVLATVPFYPMYEYQTTFFNSEKFEYGGDTSSWIMNNSTSKMDVIEFVTSPNNPDGELKKSITGGKAIYDHAYFWPHFTPIPTPSDQDLMLFTLSKLTGHAGTRFGWAVIKNKDVYEKVMEYIKVADLGISKDTQLRALKILKVVVEGDSGKRLFKYAYDKMSDRWERLTHVFSKSTRFSLQQRHPLYCSFFNKTRKPSPAYAWVKCEREEDEDCNAVLQEGNIKGRPGSTFSAKNRYVRLSLIKSQDDFELLLQRVTGLVSLENNGIESM